MDYFKIIVIEQSRMLKRYIKKNDKLKWVMKYWKDEVWGVK